MPRGHAAVVLFLLLAGTAPPTAQAAVSATASISPDEPDGLDGWYVTEPVVALAASGAAGSASVMYCLDAIDACSPVSPYTVAIDVPEGEWFLRYQAHDTAGPSSAVVSLSLNVDTTLPEVDHIVAPNADDTGPDARVEFRFSERMDKDSVEEALTADEAWDTSWTDHGETLVLQSTGLHDGTHRVRVSTGALDRHGNPLDEMREVFVTILTPRAPGAPRSVTATQVVDGVALAWRAPADAGSQPITAYVVRLGDERWDLDSGTLRLVLPLEAGSYTASVAAVNPVDEGAGVLVPFTLLLAPISEARISPAEPDGLDGWYFSPPAVSFVWTEGASVRWRLGSGAASAYTEPFDAPAGESLLRWSARAGEQVEPEHTLTLRVDLAAPALSPPTLSPDAPHAADRITIGSRAEDAHSGILEHYALVDGVRHDISGRALSLPPLAAGVHSVQTVAVDRAGRETRSEPLSFAVAAAPPAPPDDDPSTPPPDEEPTDAMHLVVETVGAALGAVRGQAAVRVDGAAPDSRILILLVDGEGRRTILSDDASATAWDTRNVPNGYYEIQVQEVSPGGAVVQRASVSVLVQNPRTDLLGLAIVLVGGVALAFAAARLRSPDLRLPAAASLAVAFAAIALAFSYARSEPMAAAIALAFLAGLYGIEIALAWTQGLDVRFRASKLGILSLAASALLFRLPFGAAGHLVDEAPGKGINRRRADALRASGMLGGAFVLALPFLILGRLGDYTLGAIGVEMALAYGAISALPIAPFAGGALWRWKPSAWALVAPVAFVPYCLYAMGLLPPLAIVALGAAGGILAARAAALLGHPAWGLRQRGGGKTPPGPLRARVGEDREPGIERVARDGL